MHTLELFFTLFHTLPLHDSHLNTGFLNVELQANWNEIKPTKWLIKFNLTKKNSNFILKFKLKLVLSKTFYPCQRIPYRSKVIVRTVTEAHFSTHFQRDLVS